MKAINLLVMFLLELGTLFAAGYWGFHLDQPLGVRTLAGIGLPLALAAIWAVFGAAANARIPLRGVARVLLEFAWFGTGALALALAGHNTWAIVFAVVYLGNFALRVLWKQEKRLSPLLLLSPLGAQE